MPAFEMLIKQDYSAGYYEGKKMKTGKILTILALALALIFSLVKVSEAAPMGTAFTYQGRFYDTNEVAHGLYDFRFRLFDADTDGNQVGSDVNKADVSVNHGYFTVELDFGSGAFDGDERSLGISIRPGEIEDPDAYTTLSPRQKLTPTPYAIHARTAEEPSVGGMPRGSIVMWAGPMFDVPAGWALCDGTNGTPDLTNRFILGVSAGEYPGATGGSHNYTLTTSQLATHNHPFTTGYIGSHSHSASSATAGAHTHKIPDNLTSSMKNKGDENGSPNWGADYSTDWTLSAGSHSHSISIGSSGNHAHTGSTANTGGNQPFDNRPAYYKLAFIMKL